MDMEDFPKSGSAKRMLSYVTAGWYDNSYVGKWLYEVMGIELDEARRIVGELPYQAFVETATWGLAYHEVKWGLPVRESLPYEERRRLIYQKRDARAPMNPYRMEMLLEGMTGREAHVDDMTGPVNTFTATLGPGDGPVDLAAVIRRLEEVKQSHVTFSMNMLTEAAGPAQANAGAAQCSWSKPPALTDGFQVTEEPVGAHPCAGIAVRSIYHRNTITEQHSGDMSRTF